jgi:hypothetical protein
VILRIGKVHGAVTRDGDPLWSIEICFQSWAVIARVALLTVPTMRWKFVPSRFTL